MKLLTQMLDLALKWVLIAAMAAIVLVVSWQVLSRYVLQSPSSNTEEMARFLLIWVGMLGAAYSYRMKAHLGLSLLTDRLGPVQGRRADALVHLCVLLFAGAVMVAGGYHLMSLTLELKQVSAAMGIEMGWVYSVVPLSGLLMMFYACEHLLTRRAG
ncbi:MAG: TRAP transporter small permease [Pseudomonadota bacterium]|uniref:TRAP transporter small permease protein n=1 Tax=Gallaecimonas pentaromativorans TaxID=584787 RepID=A0A3N1P3R7_9GAMM|nr:TRAP transporter small permease [Gallaecimonas pentaromativorans]MED5525170.1 TRAP transporter small permease [Pseudomonadota bacterium]ROQ25992.1 TRAP-type C4-dicarboxylate transport system permease small subunit [Gallaecimonas pentaromativorans]